MATRKYARIGGRAGGKAAGIQGLRRKRSRADDLKGQEAVAAVRRPESVWEAGAKEAEGFGGNGGPGCEGSPGGGDESGWLTGEAQRVGGNGEMVYRAHSAGGKGAGHPAQRTSKRRRSALRREGYDEDLKPDRNRAFTGATVYLVHKWLSEGMPLNTVARVLNRSEESVRAAAGRPVRPGERALIKRYFAPFCRRREP